MTKQLGISYVSVKEFHLPYNVHFGRNRQQKARSNPLDRSLPGRFLSEVDVYGR